MNTTRKLSVAVGLVGMACRGVAAGPYTDMDATSVTDAESVAAKLDEASYLLLVDSIFARGCMGSGSGKYGCMCPIIAASEFAGTFTLTPNHQTPPGHQAYDVSVEDWAVTFGDEVIEITGEGYYDTWTALDGSRWQAMTLDLCIYDEVITFYSGVIEGQPPEGPFPEEISIGLETDTECLGYMTVVEAERLPTGDAQTAPDTVEGKVDVEEISSS